MLFRKNRNIYKDCAVILSEEGYSENYINSVKSVMDGAKTSAEISEGKNYLAAAYLFKGDLSESQKYFSECDADILPDMIKQSFGANYILCLFLMNKFKEAEEIYEKLNKYILSDGGILMRRSMGIHQFIAGDYSAAVTVFVYAEKNAAGFSPHSPPMLDICLVKTLMKLDMYDKAAEYTADFAKYEALGKIGTLTKQMKKKIFDEISPSDKVKMIKKKKKKK